MTPHTNTDSPPPSRFARLRFLTLPFRRFGRWFTHQPRFIQIGLGCVLIAGVVVAGYHTPKYLANRKNREEVAAAQQEFQTAVQQHDFDGTRAALERWATANPDDTLPAQYLEMLDTGNADPEYPGVALLLVTHHMENNRLPEAAREAQKVLAKLPKHWLARCCVAHHALQTQQNPELANQILLQLPDPDDPDAAIRSPGTLLYALKLFTLIGRDSSDLRSLILTRVVPRINSAAVMELSASGKTQFVECYLVPFADPSALSTLTEYWAAVDRLASTTLEEAIREKNVSLLIQFAELGPRLRVALDKLQRHDPKRLTPERVEPFLTAIEERTRKAWQAVRENRPTEPQAYIGLANIEYRQGQRVAAAEALLNGLAACGDDPNLLAAILGLFSEIGTPAGLEEVVDHVWKAAEQAKTDPVKWCLAAEAKLLASPNNADYALQACANARAIQPDFRWACSLEARLWIRTGQFDKAHEALKPLGELTILRHYTHLHAQILVGRGLWAKRDEEYQKVLAVQTQANDRTVRLAIGFLAGILKTPEDVERSAWVASQAERLAPPDSEEGLVAQIIVEARYRLAELSVKPHPDNPALPPVWDGKLVLSALRAMNDLDKTQQVSPRNLARAATLELKGLGNAAAAMRTISSLRSIEATLSPTELEVLGAVLLANDQLDEAILILERAEYESRRYPTVGCLAALALAHHRAGHLVAAKNALRRADPIPGRSVLERAELVAAKLQINQN